MLSKVLSATIYAAHPPIAVIFLNVVRSLTGRVFHHDPTLIGLPSLALVASVSGDFFLASGLRWRICGVSVMARHITPSFRDALAGQRSWSVRALFFTLPCCPIWTYSILMFWLNRIWPFSQILWFHQINRQKLKSLTFWMNWSFSFFSS